MGRVRTELTALRKLIPHTGCPGCGYPRNRMDIVSVFEGEEEPPRVACATCGHYPKRLVIIYTHDPKPDPYEGGAPRHYKPTSEPAPQPEPEPQSKIRRRMQWP